MNTRLDVGRFGTLHLSSQPASNPPAYTALRTEDVELVDTACLLSHRLSNDNPSTHLTSHNERRKRVWKNLFISYDDVIYGDKNAAALRTRCAICVTDIPISSGKGTRREAPFLSGRCSQEAGNNSGRHKPLPLLQARRQENEAAGDRAPDSVRR